MTVLTPDTITPGGGFPSVMSADVGRPNGTRIEPDLAAAEKDLVRVRGTLGVLPAQVGEPFSIGVANMLALDTATTAVAFMIQPSEYAPSARAVASIGGTIQAGATAVKLRLRVWRRALTSAALDLYPGADGDVLIDTVVKPIADLGIEAGGAAVAATVPLSMPIAVDPIYAYIAELGFLGADDAPVVGCGFGYRNGTGLSDHVRGWRTRSGVKEAIASALRWAWSAIYQRTASAVASDAVATAAAVSASLAIANGMTGALGTADKVAQAFAITGTFAYENVNTRAVAYMVHPDSEIPSGKSLLAVGGTIRAYTGAVSVQARIWRRLLASSQIDDYQGATGDVLVDTITATVAGLSIDTSGGYTAFTIPLTNALALDPTYGFVVEISVLDAAGAAMQFGWRLTSASGITTSFRGWLGLVAGPQAIASPNRAGWSVLYRDTIAGVAMQGRDAASVATKAVATLAGQVGSLTGQPDVSGGLTGTTDWAPSNTTRFAWFIASGTEIALGRSLKAVGLPARAVSAIAVTLRVNVYERLLTSANIGSPPPISDDALVNTTTVSIASLGLTAAAATSSDVSIVLSTQPPARSGYGFVVEFTLLDATGSEVQFASKYLSASGAAPQRRGWYRTTSSYATVAANLALGRSYVSSATVASVAAQALALTQAGTSTNMARALRSLCPNIGNEGLRIVNVFSEDATADNTTAKTYQQTIELAQGFDAFRVVFSNGGAAYTVGKSAVSVRANINPTDNNNGAVWLPVRVAGADTFVVPASPGYKRVSYVVSDWIYLSSPARDDGGNGGVAIVRSSITTLAALSLVNCRRFDASATRANGYAWGNRENVGDCVTTIANFTSTVNTAFTPVCGFNYAARGVVAVMGCAADSIGEGRADTIDGDGFVVRMCRDMKALSGIAWEPAQIAWTGSNTTIIRQRYDDLTAAGLHLDFCLYSGGSINDVGLGSAGTAFTQAKIDTIRQNRYRSLREMRVNGAVPIVYTWGPFSAAATPNLGATDSFRQVDNAEIVTLADRGIIVADFASALKGSVAASGQEEPIAGATADGAHPTGARYDLLAPIGTSALRAALGI